MDEIVRLQTLTGVWEVGGVDRMRGIWAEDVRCNWDNWGPKTASLTFKRDPAAPFPDLLGLTPIEIEKGSGIWEGYIDQTPEPDGSSVGVECIGWQDQGDEDVEKQVYVHDRLTEWKDWRSHLASNLAVFKTSYNVEVGNGAVVIGGPAVADAGVPRGGIYIDLGSGPSVRRVVIEWEKNQWAAGAAQAFVSRAMTAGGLDAGGTLVSTLSDANTTGTFSFTFSGPARYVRIWCETSAAQATDRFFRIKSVKLFRLPAYEASGISVLKGSAVLAHAFPRLCRDWSTDATGIDTTVLNIPHFAATEPRTFREYAEAVNAFHGYVLKLERGRRLRFKPRPLIPVLAASKARGVVFRDTAKNATRDVYNKAIGRGQDTRGDEVQIVRYASQQPGVKLEAIDTPAPTNPSAAVDTSSWAVTGAGVLSRDTVVFDTTPASFKVTGFTVGDFLTGGFTGTFEEGVTYVLSVRVRTTGAVNLYFEWGDLDTEPRGGGDYTYYEADMAANTWTTINFVWTPLADYISPGTTAIEFRVQNPKDTTTLNLDTLILQSARPTIYDKRGRVRAKTITMPAQTVAVAVAESFADVWLQSHMKTRARGELTAQGRVLEDFLTGQPREPFEVGELTGELVCLLDETDPDTFQLGRDARIASVEYSGADDSVKVDLDDQSEDYEKIVARYDLLSGGN
jgi:hypothetical protein